jgi:cytochrome c2
VEGEDAPPQAPPGQAPERQGSATEAQPEATAAGEAAAPAAPAGQPAAEAPEQEELAQATAPAEPAAAAAGGGAFGGGDAAAGEKLFRRCAACHKLEDGKNGIGPHLWGVVGRDVASVEGYQYSDAMQAHEGAWTAQHLSDYIAAPHDVVPGTKMAFAGLKDEQDRIDLITYLNEADGSPEPLE